METSNFGILDFIIFGGAFIISLSIGLVFGYKDRNNQSTENYYFGGRKLGTIPVAISLAVTYVSALTVIGVPTEVYLYGSVFIWYIVEVWFVNLIAVVYYIPIFHRLRLSSLYEYLELRFSKKTRQLTSAVGLVYLALYLSFAVYVPSLALSAVTPVSLNWTIALISLTCTFYTTLGGIKAVIWTDVLQSFIMIIGLIAVLVRGYLVVGGYDSIISAAERGGRNNFFSFDIDPRIRSTFWSIIMGYGLLSCFAILCNQMLIQRWLSCRTIASSRSAVGLSLILFTLLAGISSSLGLIAYAYYEGCDPLMTGKITKIDQILPKMVVEIYQDVPGMAGLFVSAVFCAALSTVSSGINSSATLLLVDFFLPRFPNLASSKQVIFSKMLSFFVGILTMVLTYIISLSSSNVIPIVGSVTGFTGGPIFSVFMMGIMMPWINHKGALVGFISGFVCTTWVGLSALIHSTSFTNQLPVSMENCTDSILVRESFNDTQASTTAMTPLSLTSNIGQVEDERFTIYNTLYAISPYYHGILGFLTSIISAHIASLIFGFSKPSEANSALFVPIIDNKLMPENIRKIFRFGVPEQTDIKRNSTTELINLSKK